MSNRGRRSSRQAIRPEDAPFKITEIARQLAPLVRCPEILPGSSFANRRCGGWLHSAVFSAIIASRAVAEDRSGRAVCGSPLTGISAMPVRLASAQRPLPIGGSRGRMLLFLAFGCAWCLATGSAAADPVIVEDDTPPDRPLLALDSGGHTDAVYKMAATQYGDQLVSVGRGQDDSILGPRHRRAACACCARRSAGRNFGYLFAVAVSPDGKRLAVGGLPRPDAAVRSSHPLDFAARRARSCTASRGTSTRSTTWRSRPTAGSWPRPATTARVRIWDVESGDPIKVLQGHAGVVHAVGLEPRRQAPGERID